MFDSHRKGNTISSPSVRREYIIANSLLLKGNIGLPPEQWDSKFNEALGNMI